MIKAAVSLDLPPEFIDLIADAVADRLTRRSTDCHDRWLCGAEAAASYLGWPKGRVYKRLARIPHARDGRLLMFNTGELDRFLTSGSGTGLEGLR